MYFKWLGVLVVVLVTSTLFPGIWLEASQEEDVPSSIFVIYAPLANLTTIAQQLEDHNMSCRILRAVLDIPESPDSFALWVLTGRKLVENISMLNISEELASRAIRLWYNAALVDIPIVDPSKHNYTINPLSRVKLHFPPQILSIPVNGSAHWELLNTNVTVILEDAKLEVKLDAYGVTMVSLNITTMRELGPRPIRVNTTNGESYDYYVAFYVINVDEREVKLFFPGAMSTYGYMSQGINPIEGLNVYWYIPLVERSEVLDMLPNDAKAWWIAKSIDFSSRMIMRALSDINVTVYHIYLPHLVYTRALILEDNVINQVMSRFNAAVIDTIYYQILSKKPNSIIIIISLNKEENVLLTGAVSNLEEDFELTMSQLVGILMSYSDVFVIPNAKLLVAAEEARRLRDELSDTKIKLKTLELDLNNTKTQLSLCESELNLAQSRLVSLNKLESEARNMYNVAMLYITTGLIATVVMSASLGYLAYKVSSKKK